MDTATNILGAEWLLRLEAAAPGQHSYHHSLGSRIQSFCVGISVRLRLSAWSTLARSSETPSELVERTMAALHHRQSGIVLMHDIHVGTVRMLPDLLSRLRTEGCKVVTLRYKRSRMPMPDKVG